MSLVLGFRSIERVKGVHHPTVITWVKQVGALLPDAYDPETLPEVGELDERFWQKLFPQNSLMNWKPPFSWLLKARRMRRRMPLSALKK